MLDILTYWSVPATLSQREECTHHEHPAATDERLAAFGRGAPGTGAAPPPGEDPARRGKRAAGGPVLRPRPHRRPARPGPRPRPVPADPHHRVRPARAAGADRGRAR